MRRARLLQLRAQLAPEELGQGTRRVGVVLLGLARALLRLRLLPFLREHGEAVIEALQLLLLIGADDPRLIGARSHQTQVQPVGRRRAPGGGPRPRLSDEAKEQAARGGHTAEGQRLRATRAPHAGASRGQARAIPEHLVVAGGGAQVVL